MPSAKKRRSLHDAGNPYPDGGRRNHSDFSHPDTSKPSAEFHPLGGGRPWTLSIAVPGSIISECATPEQRMTSPGRIARALAVFGVDELVLYDDGPASGRRPAVDEGTYTAEADPCHFLAHVFSYLEAPPFMRKTLFPLHPNLRLSGLLPSLDMSHHPNPRDQLLYCEGVTASGQTSTGSGTLVEIGFPEPVEIASKIPPKTRVTLRFSEENPDASPEPVHPDTPRTEAGYSWGYAVRRCGSLSAVFTESTYEDGYDVTIGTSERGAAIAKAIPTGPLTFRHLVVVFGGPRGIEFAATNDAELSARGVCGARTSTLFDYWVNVLPDQGSRTIRTDEAVFIGLTALRRAWRAEG